MKYQAKTALVTCRAHEKLKEKLPLIGPDESYEMVSMGDWSTHDLLLHLLGFTGPASVYFTTWAISEYAIRQLYNYCQQRIILELHGIFDYRNRINKSGQIQFLQQFAARIVPAKCHAKVTVILNDQWGIAISGSANYTRNPRIENFHICSFRHVALGHRQWIEEVLENNASFDRKHG